MLEVERLSFAFSGRRILHDISLRLTDGETVAVLGRSGAGKSSLLRVLTGLLRPQNGSVTLDGRSFISDGELVGDVQAFRRKVVLVPQEGGLWTTMSAAENVALPLVSLQGVGRSAALQRAYALAETVSLDSATLDRPPGELSGGQRQKIALLRAIVLDPSWLLLDEPTANLDPTSSLEIAKLVRMKSREGLGAMIVTHDLGFALNAADAYCFLDGGAIVSAGRWPELQTSGHPAVQAFIEGAARPELKLGTSS